MNSISIPGFDLYLTREYLKAGLLVSLLSVWVLVGLFYYLNRYTRRRYFTIWTAAWLFYALWLTLNFGITQSPRPPGLLMAQNWCVGVSAVFLLWGGLRFLARRVRQSLFGWFIAFLLVWSYIGAYHLTDPWQVNVPIFGMIGLSSILTASCFLRYRRKREYIGATLLALGFFLWGAYMGAYPFLETSEDMVSVALFISAALQLFLAVSMIILVLEEVRHTHQVALQQVHSKKRAGEELQTRVSSTEERYRNLFNQAADAIVITTADSFQILDLNKAAARLLGVSAEEASHHTLATFFQVAPGSSVPQTADEWFQWISSKRLVSLMKKNGGVVPLEVEAGTITLDNKPAYQFFMREMTERTRLEQQLRQAEKLSAMGKMISGVAHELNNPLAVIKGYLDLILTHHKLPTQTRIDLEKVVQESNRAAKLVVNFLSFAREQPARRERIHLNALLNQVLELRKFDMVVVGVDLSLELESDLPPISADPDQIQQVLVNLISNAVHAMSECPKPSRLRIRTVHSKGQVLLSMEDSGPGIPAELEAKIFEPFFTTKEVGTGTGLGLSIAHSIMTEHQGRILYQPAALGGARFVLEFPAAPAEILNLDVREDRANSVPAAERGPVRCGRILVLDDEKSIAEMLGEMLGLLGHETFLSHTGAHALELMEQQEFDVIVSDFRMPGLNGQQFYELATRKWPELATRIVFLTGDLVNEETQNFLKSTGTRHLAKPFQLAAVEEIVNEVMQGRSRSLATMSAN